MYIAGTLQVRCSAHCHVHCLCSAAARLSAVFPGHTVHSLCAVRRSVPLFVPLTTLTLARFSTAQDASAGAAAAASDGSADPTTSSVLTAEPPALPPPLAAAGPPPAPASGIAATSTPAATTTLTILGSTITGNNATGSGGAIFLQVHVRGRCMHARVHACH